MIVFKTFLKIMNRNKFMIILFTAIALIMGILNSASMQKADGFIATKPQIVIYNNDDSEITKSLIKYLSKNAEIQENVSENEANNMLFYRIVDCIITIPQGFGENLLNNDAPKKIDIRKNDVGSSVFAEMIINNYVKTFKLIRSSGEDEQEIINNTEKVLEKSASVEIKSNVDKSNLENVSAFYNFSNYTILMCIIFLICTMMTTFNQEKIKKRTLISSTNPRKINLYLFLANCIYALSIWVFYFIIGFILYGNVMLTKYGLLYTMNILMLVIFAVAFSLFISSLIKNKSAIQGISNVFSLGTSFLCGSFVPTSFYSESIIKFAKIFPSYYFIKNNEIIKGLEYINSATLKTYFINLIVIGIYTLVLIVLTNIITTKKKL